MKPISVLTSIFDSYLRYIYIYIYIYMQFYLLFIREYLQYKHWAFSFQHCSKLCLKLSMLLNKLNLHR